MRLSNRFLFIALVSIFIIALGLRIGLAAKFVGLDSPPDMDANPDQIDYEWGAYQIVEGNGLVNQGGQPTATRTPGTALTLAPAYALFGRSFAAGRIWFCFISAATCFAVAWVAYQLAGRGAAIISAALLAVYPGHAYYAMHFVSEVPYAFYIAFATAFSIRSYQAGGRAVTLAAGICWAMAIHCRPQLILLPPIALVAVLLLYRAVHRVQWVGAMRMWAVQTCIITAIVAPWFVRNAVVMGKPVFTTIAGHGLWGSHNPLTFHDANFRGDWIRVSELEHKFGALPRGELAKDAEATRRGWHSIAVNLPRLPQIALYKVGRLLNPFLDTPNKTVRWAFALAWIAVVPLIVIGSWHAWRHARTSTFILFMPVLATLATVVLFYGSIRFRDSIAPLFITIAGIGAAELLSMIASARGHRAIEKDSTAPQSIPLPRVQERKAA